MTMRSFSLRFLLGGIALAGAVGAVRFALAASPAAFAEPESVPAAGAAAPAAANADSLAQAIVARNPFRIHRTAAGRPYRPESDDEASQPPAAPPRPTLVLSGILVDDEPTALIEGIPGTLGVHALRLGEAFERYRLTEVRAEYVVVAGPDTTWILQLRSRHP